MKASLVLMVLAQPAVAEVECATIGAVMGELYSQTQSYQMDWSYRLGDASDGCVFHDVEGRALVEAEEDRPFFADQIVKVAELRVSGEALDRLLAGGLPDALRMEVDGYYVTLSPEAEFYRYSSEVQARFLASDAVLEMTWDDASGVWDVSQFAVTLGWGQTVDVAVRVDGVDGLSRQALEASLPLASVSAADVTLTGAGLFEFFVLDWIGWQMELMAEPPADWLADRVAARQADIVAAPEAVLSEAAKAAAVAFLDDLPHPDGMLRIGVTAEPGLGMARFGRFAIAGPPETIVDLWPALEGVVVDVEYQPETSQ